VRACVRACVRASLHGGWKSGSAGVRLVSVVVHYGLGWCLAAPLSACVLQTTLPPDVLVCGSMTTLLTWNKGTGAMETVPMPMSDVDCVAAAIADADFDGYLVRASDACIAVAPCRCLALALGLSLSLSLSVSVSSVAYGWTC
jgi:hypothetical protein